MKHVATKIERDRLLIESVVWRYGPISRAHIHHLTNLRQSGISRVVSELTAEGRLLQAGRADNPKGRKRILLRINADHRYVLGVGFDDENVLASVMDLQLHRKSDICEPAVLDGGEAAVVGQLLRCAKQAVREAGVEARRLLGIGVAGSGLVNAREGVLQMSSTLEFLKQVPLQRIFEKEFRVPTAVENLTRAKAAAERALGAGEMADNMIYIEYGRTGIGAGIILNGKLFYGSGYAAGEFGHTHMIADGPACKCGAFGCLEAIAGAGALEAKIRKAIAEGSTSEALALAGGNVDNTSGWIVLQGAGMGDKTCSVLVEQMATYLGLGLANLVNLFNPSVLVLDQRLSLAGQSLMDQILRTVKLQALGHSARNLSIRFASLGTPASVLGAASIVLDNYFEIPALKPPRFLVESVPTPLRRGAPAPSVAPVPLP